MHSTNCSKPGFEQLGDPEQWGVVFDEPQKAAAVGQSVVVYDGDICLGGGVLAKIGMI